MMEIVIKISEEDYKTIKSNYENGFSYRFFEIIANGTVIPEGHGDLIDKDRLLDELEKTVKSVDDTNKHLLFWDRAIAHIHLSKPIIEAECTYKETGCGSCKRQLDCPMEAEGSESE